MESLFIKAFKLEKHFFYRSCWSALYWLSSVADVFSLPHFGASGNSLLYLGDKLTVVDQ